MKTNYDELYFKRKEEFVKKEFDTGFSSYQRLEGKVSSLRQWTITINVGFVLYILANNKNLLILLIAITIFMLILLLLELRTRSTMTFDKKNILLLEKMFNERDFNTYRQLIENYQFRDQRLTQLTALIKLRHCFCAILQGEVIVWYTMWGFIWAGLIIAIRFNWFITHIWIALLLIVPFIAITIYLIVKYFKLNK